MEVRSTIEELKLENSRLQLKVRAQEAVCQKLMREKDAALKALEESEENIRLLQHEFEIREKMFLKNRDDNQKEIAALKNVKQNLEARLASLLDSDDDAMDNLDANRGMTFSSVDVISSFSTLPKLSAKEAVDTLSKWEGMESTVALLRAGMEDESDHMKWKPGSPWTSKWKFIITLYISAPPDTHGALEIFMEECMPRLVKQSEESGCCLNNVVMDVPEVQSALSDAHSLSYSASIVEKSDVFLSILKDDADQLTKVEVERGFLNCPNAKPGVFLLIPHSSSPSTRHKGGYRLKDRIKKMKNTANASVFECGDDVREGLMKVSNELSRILRQEFEVFEAPIKSGGDLMERVAYQEDMRREWEQTEMLQNLLVGSPTSLVGVDEVFLQLEDYLNEEGPVATLLLTGLPGSGKSTILAKWIEQLAGVEDSTVVVLYHFVSSLCSSNAEITVIYRHFLQKMMYYCNDVSVIPYCPSELEREFVSWIEKLSTQLNDPDDRLVIVIDGADLITDHDKYMSWVCKPLSNRTRVVLSATEENYPDAWKNLPSPSIPTPTSVDIIDIINRVQDKSTNGLVLNEEQVSMLAICAPEVPIWCVLATRNLQRCVNMSCDEVDEYIESLDEYQEVPDLVVCMLDSIHTHYSALASGFEKILKLVYCSRNGLLLSEIITLTGMPSGLVSSILLELQSRLMISTGSVYALSNEQVQEAVLLKYSVTPYCDYLQLWTAPLLDCFSDFTGKKAMLIRSVEELPWLLKRAELSHELLKVVLDVDFLIFISSSGRTGELLNYWSYLNTDPCVLAEEYHTILLGIEESQMVPVSELSSLFRTVGKILVMLGFTEQALRPLQYALELSEAFSDPDSADIGSTLYALASLHHAADRLSTAEEFYKQSLDIFEASYHEKSPLVLKALQELAVVYKKAGKTELSDEVYARILSIKDASERSAMETSELLQKRAEELEELSTTCTHPDELAVYLNELGVILTVYGDINIAEEKFLQSLKHFEMVPENTGILVILKNLGRFYLEKKRFDLAIPLYENVYEFTVKNLPTRHSDLLVATEELALLHREQGSLQRAELLQSTGPEEIRQETAPDAIRHVLITFLNLCTLYVRICNTKTS